MQKFKKLEEEAEQKAKDEARAEVLERRIDRYVVEI